jgi:hypothetical protein
MRPGRPHRHRPAAPPGPGPGDQRSPVGGGRTPHRRRPATPAIQRVVADAIVRFGRLDVVVSNAGFACSARLRASNASTSPPPSNWRPSASKRRWLNGTRTNFNRHLAMAEPIAAYQDGILGQIRGMLAGDVDPGAILLAVPGDPSRSPRPSPIRSTYHQHPGASCSAATHSRPLHIPIRRTAIPNTPLQHDPIRLRNLQEAHQIQHAPSVRRAATRPSWRRTPRSIPD